jgi:hypothetical protein
MQEAPMNPISQIELNARFRDLERQVATARQSQGAVLDWLKMLWRKRPRTAHRDTTKSLPLTPTPVR